MFREQQEPVLVEQETKVPPEKQKIVDEIVNLGKKTNNSLHFLDYGPKEGKSNSGIKLKEKVLNGLDEEKRETLELTLEVLKLFVSGPIFTDGFHTNHKNFKDLNAPSRFKWEKDNIYNLSEDARNYYNLNRLNLGSRIGPTVNFLQIASDEIENAEIKGKLKEIIDVIPKELLEENCVGYNNAPDIKKVEIVNKFSEIVDKAIDLLEEKNI